MDQKAFAQQLHKGEIHEIYYFYGEEKLLLEQSIKALKEKLLPAGLEDFNFDRYAGDKVTPRQIAEMAMNLPFMAERRLLVIDSPLSFLSIPKSDKEGQESLRQLLQYLEQPNPQCCLILRGESSLNKTGEINKCLQEKAVLVEFATVKGKALESWIVDYLSQNGQTIQREAVEYLSAMNSFDLEIMEKELDKLSLFTQGQGEITKQQVVDIVTRTIEANIFDLSDHLGHKRGREALQVLQNMLTLGEPPLKILAILVKHIQNLLLVKDYQGQGMNDSQIKEKTKLHPYVIKKSAGQAKRFTVHQLITALGMLLEAEVELKSTATPADEVLERFVLELCYLS